MGPNYTSSGSVQRSQGLCHPKRPSQSGQRASQSSHPTSQCVIPLGKGRYAPPTPLLAEPQAKTQSHFPQICLVVPAPLFGSTEDRSNGSASAWQPYCILPSSAPLSLGTRSPSPVSQTTWFGSVSGGQLSGPPSTPASGPGWWWASATTSTVLRTRLLLKQPEATRVCLQACCTVDPSS